VGGSIYTKFSHRRGRPQPIIFALIVRPINALQLCHWQFSQKETLWQTSFKRSVIIDEKWLFCISEPPLGELGATYDYHLRVIGKHVADFLLMLTELFSLGVTAEALRANIHSKSAISLQRGSVNPKFEVEWVAPPHQPFFFSEN